MQRGYKKVYDNRNRKYIIINNYNQYVRDATPADDDEDGWAIQLGKRPLF